MQVEKMDRNELLRDRTRENKVLFNIWHPKLGAVPSILNNNFHLISKIFK